MAKAGTLPEGFYQSTDQLGEGVDLDAKQNYEVNENNHLEEYEYGSSDESDSNQIDANKNLQAEINPRNYFLVRSFEIWQKCKIQQCIFCLNLRSNVCFTVEIKAIQTMGRFYSFKVRLVNESFRQILSLSDSKVTVVKIKPSNF